MLFLVAYEPSYLPARIGRGTVTTMKDHDIGIYLHPGTGIEISICI